MRREDAPTQSAGFPADDLALNPALAVSVSGSPDYISILIVCK